MKAVLDSAEYLASKKPLHQLCCCSVKGKLAQTFYVLETQMSWRHDTSGMQSSASEGPFNSQHAP